MHLKTHLTLIVITSLLGACASRPEGSVDAEKNLLGYGIEVSTISETIYQIEVRINATKDVASARDAAMLRASGIALARAYPAFEIIGGTGFKKRGRKARVGPVPLLSPGEPSGGLVIKLRKAGSSAPEVFDAGRVQREVRSRLKI